jgi:hypothetical protein
VIVRPVACAGEAYGVLEADVFVFDKLKSFEAYTFTVYSVPFVRLASVSDVADAVEADTSVAPL